MVIIPVFHTDRVLRNRLSSTSLIFKLVRTEFQPGTTFLNGRCIWAVLPSEAGTVPSNVP